MWSRSSMKCEYSSKDNSRNTLGWLSGHNEGEWKQDREAWREGWMEGIPTAPAVRGRLGEGQSSMQWWTVTPPLSEFLFLLHDLCSQFFFFAITIQALTVFSCFLFFICIINSSFFNLLSTLKDPLMFLNAMVLLNQIPCLPHRFFIFFTSLDI